MSHSSLHRVCFRIGLGLVVSLVGRAELIASDLKPAEMVFEKPDPKRLKESLKILSELNVHFKKVFNKSVGVPSIEIQMDRTLNEDGLHCSFDGRVEGLTIYSENGCVIQISKDRTSTWGRILAHELAHVLVQKTFGNVKNKWLREGIAEYLASESFPSEVKTAQRKYQTRKWVPEETLPYIEGLAFCDAYAKEAHFAEFFEAELARPVESLGELEMRWELFRKSKSSKVVPK